METPEILVVVLEYSVSLRRVMVRGVFGRNEKTPDLMEPENYQNRVQVFRGVDMGRGPGFTGLVPGGPEPENAL